MFNKTKSDDSYNGSRNNGDQIRTLISEGCKFEGNLTSPFFTRIDGQVIGNIKGDNGVIIGDTGMIEGDVHAVEVIICGKINGNIKAKKVELRKEGTLNGNIIVEELVTEAGTKFNGCCKMTRDKLVERSVDDELLKEESDEILKEEIE
jgi:cytoskeletal protein CcmA (bactofilin family)